MISVVASIRIRPGKIEEFLKIFKGNIPHVLAEDGCIEYYPTIDAATDIEAQNCDDALVTIVEKWETVDALKKHLTAPHMLIYREQVSDIVLGAELKILATA